MELDLVGVDASIANALRRIMMAEVPTIAIEHVFIHENNTVMPDEVLAMRLGHVPIHFPAFRLDEPSKGSNQQFTENDSLVFQLRTVCRRNPAHRDNRNTATLHPRDRYLNSELTSAMLVWKPEGNQIQRLPQAREEFSFDFEANRRLKEHFKSFWEQRKQQYLDAVHMQTDGAEDGAQALLTQETCVPFPVHSDIVLNKMRPRQVVSADMIAVKGIGRDHAKFTPVSVASYRLLPDIIIKQPIVGEEAEKFKACFNAGVIDVVPNAQGQLHAVVADARRCTMSRECYRHPEFKDKVLLTRVRDHFICTLIRDCFLNSWCV
jgi:DNA-directed RNA polymerase I and III subunit RPAC1